MKDPGLAHDEFDELYRRSTVPSMYERSSAQPLVHYSRNGTRNRSQPHFFTPQPQILTSTRSRLNVLSTSLSSEPGQVFTRPSNCLHNRSHDFDIPSERLSRRQFFSPQPRLIQQDRVLRSGPILFEKRNLSCEGPAFFGSTENIPDSVFSRDPFSGSRGRVHVVGRERGMLSPPDGEGNDEAISDGCSVHGTSYSRQDVSVTGPGSYRAVELSGDCRRHHDRDYHDDDVVTEEGGWRPRNRTKRGHLCNINKQHIYISPGYDEVDGVMVDDHMSDHHSAVQNVQIPRLNRREYIQDSLDLPSHLARGDIGLPHYDPSRDYPETFTHQHVGRQKYRSNLTVENVEYLANQNPTDRAQNLPNSSRISSSSCENLPQTDNLLDTYELSETVRKTRDHSQIHHLENEEIMDGENGVLDKASDVLPYAADMKTTEKENEPSELSIYSPGVDDIEMINDTRNDSVANIDDSIDDTADDTEQTGDKTRKSNKRKAVAQDHIDRDTEEDEGEEESLEGTSQESDKRSEVKDKGAKKKKTANELHLWIIKALPQVKGLCVEGKRKITDEHFWHSSVVTKRVNKHLVETNSGSQYRLIGDMVMEDALSGGFDASTIQLFAEGFPKNWKSIVSKYYKQKERNVQRHNHEAIATPANWRERRGKENGKKMSVSCGELRTPTLKDQVKENDVFTPDGHHIQLDSVKKTRSGRVSKPMVAWWAGQAIKLDSEKNTLIMSHQTKYAEEVLQDLSTIYKNIAMKKKASRNSLSKKLNDRSTQDLKKSGDSPIVDTSVHEGQVTTGVSLNVEREVCTILDNMKQSRRRKKEQRNKATTCYEKEESEKRKNKGSKSRDVYSVDEDSESENDSTRKHQKEKRRTRSSGRGNKKREKKDTDSVPKNDSRLMNEQRDHQKDVRERPHELSEFTVNSLESKKRGQTKCDKVGLSYSETDDDSDDSMHPAYHTRLKDKQVKRLSKKSVTEKPGKDTRSERQRQTRSRTKVTQGEGQNNAEKENIIQELKRRKRTQTHQNVHVEKRRVSDSDANEGSRRTRSMSQTKGQRNVKDSVTKDSDSSDQDSDTSDEDFFTRNQGTVKRNNVRSRVHRDNTKTTGQSTNMTLRLEDEKESDNNSEDDDDYSRHRGSVNNKSKLKEKNNRKRATNSVESSSDEDEEERSVPKANGRKARSKLRRNGGKTRTKSTDGQSQNAKVNSGSTEDIRWNKDEVIRLNMIMRKIRGDDPDFWNKVAMNVKTKTVEECQNYYYKELPKNAKKKTKETSEKGKEKILLTAGVGTLKRKQQLRDIIDNANEEYQEDLFDGTPYRSNPVTKIPRLNQDEDRDVFAELADRNPHIAGKVFTPMTRLNIQPVSTQKTPASQLVSPWPAIDRKDADKYMRQMHIRRRRLVGKNAKTPVNKPVNTALLPSPTKNLFSKPADDLQSLFMEEGNSSDNHKDSEEENDYYFSSGDEN